MVTRCAGIKPVAALIGHCIRLTKKCSKRNDDKIFLEWNKLKACLDVWNMQTGQTGRTTTRAVRIAHERMFREPADNMATTRGQPFKRK